MTEMHDDRELEALLLTAAKATDRGVVGVDKTRAREWGVPVGKLVQAGETLPGHSRKAKVAAYFCPYSVWRPPSGECFIIDVDTAPTRAVYRLAVLREDSTGHYHFAGQLSGFHLEEMKAYLRGVADCAYVLKSERR